MATMGPRRRYANERLAASLLKMARARRGWTQRELAAAAGVPQSTVGRIEAGLSQPTLPMLGRLLAAADLELRARLEPYDDHDDVLDALEARMTPKELAAREAVGDRLIETLRGAPVVSQ